MNLIAENCVECGVNFSRKSTRFGHSIFPAFEHANLFLVGAAPPGFGTPRLGQSIPQLSAIPMPANSNV